MDRFTASYSALQQFFSDCQARYTFYVNWNTVKISPWFVFGNKVHKFMEERTPAHDTEDDFEAWRLADKLWDFVESKGYKLTGEPEIKHFAPLTDDIDVFGKIDRLAIAPDGALVVIDWKTAKSPWSSLKRVHGGTEHVTPQSLTWQAELYLQKPYGWEEPWAEYAEFIVAPKDGGPVRTHRYQSTPEARANLVLACEALRDAVTLDRFPKNYGYPCGGCRWKDVCWNIAGWESKFVARGGRKDAEIELETD